MHSTISHVYTSLIAGNIYQHDEIYWMTFICITGSESPGVDANGNSFDFTTKLLHLAWHPTENSIACAAANSLYMYYA